MKQATTSTTEQWKHSGSEGEQLSPPHQLELTPRTSSFSPREEQPLTPRPASRAFVRKDIDSPLQLRPLQRFSSKPDDSNTSKKLTSMSPASKLKLFRNFSSSSPRTAASSSDEECPDLFNTYIKTTPPKSKNSKTTKSKNHPPVKKEYLGTQLNFYHKAISTSPQVVEHYINLGKVYLKKGDNPMAVSYFKQALQLDPKPFCFLVLGNALLNNRSFTEAEEIFTQIKTLISGGSSTKHALSSHTIRTLSTDIDIYKIKHKLMLIINHNVNILELINKNAIEGIKQTYLTIGDACVIYTNYDSSTTKMLETAVVAYSKAGIIEAYHKIIKLDPENTYGQTSIAFYNLGQFNSEEDPHKAINYFKRAISLSPKFVDAYIMTAALYQDEEDLTRAGEYYKKATKYFPQLYQILHDFISQGLSAKDSPPLRDSSFPKDYNPTTSSAEELADIIFYFYTNEDHYSESCKELTQTIELLGTI